MKENNTTTQNNEPSKGLKEFSTIMNTIINVMIIIVLITSILIAVMAISSKSSGISTILGHTIQTIESDSMKGGSPDGYPEGDFSNGDLMIAKATGRNPDAKYDIGDIVTYMTYDVDGNTVLIVHRIVDAVDTKSGETVYQTQGDNREMSEVPDQLSVEEYLPADRFVSVYYTSSYTGHIIKGVGGFLDYLRSQQGFFFVVLLPMIIFFMYELIRVVMNFSNYKRAVAEEDKDEAVKNAVSEALAAQKNENMPSSLEEMSPEQLEQFKQFIKQQEEAKAAEESKPEE